MAVQMHPSLPQPEDRPGPVVTTVDVERFLSYVARDQPLPRLFIFFEVCQNVFPRR